MTRFPGLKTSGLLLAALSVPVLLLAQENAGTLVEVASEAVNASGSAALDAIPPEVKFAMVTLGSGGIAGWAVGFTLKKVAKLAALVVGVAFISIQYRAYKQYITIDWDKIRQSVPNESIERSYAEMMSVLTYNLPFAGAFIVGFWLGFRKG
ncbi:MAG: FUN14 domain-containing protein [Candidatus Riflebacteria bacterium]